MQPSSASGERINQVLYVSTDSNGIEHAATGQVRWLVPAGGAIGLNPVGHPLVLRQPKALLDVLDERIYSADSPDVAKIGADGTCLVNSARLVTDTGWDTELATRFALDCADHILSGAGDIALPNGLLLSEVIVEAREMLDGLGSEGSSHLGYLARLRALRRLRRERAEIADLSLGLLTSDELRDIDALDDPAYVTVIPVTDSVLAAIEALRHHVLPKVYMEIEDLREEHEQHDNLDNQLPVRGPSVVVTGFGSVVTGSGFLTYEPSWTAAREAARHARLAARDREGANAEAEQLAWQAALLGSILDN